MKKSEALNALGLTNGATDDEVKQAHRKLVIAHHPDKFPLESAERAQAEEFTKKINEARDVLLNRTFTPEFDPRRDARPYANPYARPGYPGSNAGSPGQPSQTNPQDPFVGWPFGQGQGAGQTTYVWTSWDSAGAASGDNPFDPFAPFREPQKTPQEVLDQASRSLKRETLALALKLVVLAVCFLLGTLATGLFLYVIASVLFGLYKRLGSCLIALSIPLALIGAPFVFMIAPQQGAVTVGLSVAFFIAVLFDMVNVRNLIRVYRAAKVGVGGK